MKYLNLLAKTKEEKIELYKRYLHSAHTGGIFYVLEPTFIGERNGKMVFAKSYMTMAEPEVKRYIVIDDFSMELFSYNQIGKNDNLWAQTLPFSKSWVVFMCKELNAISPDLMNDYINDFKAQVRKTREEQKYKMEEIYNAETESYISDVCQRSEYSLKQNSQKSNGLSQKYIDECCKVAKKLHINDLTK